MAKKGEMKFDLFRFTWGIAHCQVVGLASGPGLNFKMMNILSNQWLFDSA
jgi:hypothetical protein